MSGRGKLQGKFEGYGRQPSENLWGNIAQKMDQKRKKRGLILFWSFGSAIAASLILIFTIYNTSSNSSTLNNLSEKSDKQNNTLDLKPSDKSASTLKNNNKITQDLPNNNLVNEISDSINENESNPFKGNNSKNLSKNIKRNNSSKTDLTQSLSPTSNKQLDRPKGPKNSFVDSLGKNTIQKPVVQDNFIDVDMAGLAIHKMNNSREEQIPNSNLPSAPNERPITKYKTTSKWSFSLQAQSNHSKNNIFEKPDAISTFNYNSGADVPESVYGLENQSININTINSIKTTRPFSIRAHLNYKFSRKFSVISGLDFGLIRSKVRYSLPNSLINSSVFTIGLPVKLGYQISQKKRWGLGTSLGSLNEFTVIQSEGTKYSNSNTAAANSANKSKTKFAKGMLNGLEANLHFDFYLIEGLKLQFSPGFKWYFRQAYTIDSPSIIKPTFNTLNIGLSWDL